ncbi:ribonuclease HII [Candidatus Magnetomonas plexicatena]|uniref:ribonuclease HII n=1 Tax=Candidatus Magnetomonas plexicatena TaxID=2552947 RepID=UPI001C77C06B|nr:ribonuclease HII [Nitrospirales bacterium LBB_01]
MSALFDFDREYITNGHTLIGGIDEAGRGPLAGPVVAACVILPAGIYIEGLNDSKKLTEAARNRIFKELLYNKAVRIGLGIATNAEIDSVNILNATRIAMKRAVTDVPIRPKLLLIDAVKLKDIDIEQVSIIKGDEKSASIASASVIAKVVRDSIMSGYHKTYPQYGFIRHKGYGTREHVANIKEHGPCEIHRMTFAPVSKMI